MTAGEVINKNIRYGEMALIAQRNLYGEDKDAVVSIKTKVISSYFFIQSEFVER